MLYHDIKNKCINAMVKGVKTAFFEYLLLSDGRTVTEIAEKELIEMVPKMITET